MPEPIRRRGADGLAHHVAELVMDGVLEVRDGDRFVVGPSAFPLLCSYPKKQAACGALARLSIEALRYE